MSIKHAPQVHRPIANFEGPTIYSAKLLELQFTVDLQILSTFSVFRPWMLLQSKEGTQYWATINTPIHDDTMPGAYICACPIHMTQIMPGQLSRTTNLLHNQYNHDREFIVMAALMSLELTPSPHYAP